MLVVHTLPAFSDNYIWLFHQQGSHEAFVVDPGDAEPVQQALKTLGLNLAGILVTHQHPDHIGGIPALLESSAVPVHGPADISVVNQPVAEGDRIAIANTGFNVIAVPGHTLNHLAYFTSSPADDQAPILFCGDTLFASGCGRLFEGSASQMYHSLKKFCDLPDNTLVYCAHEYTLANLEFALAVDPDNADLQQRMKHCQQLRQGNIPTVPFPLSEDLQTNPFLRSEEAAIIQAAKQHTTSSDPVSVFAAIRHWKDNF